MTPTVVMFYELKYNSLGPTTYHSMDSRVLAGIWPNSPNADQAGIPIRE